MLVVGGVHFSSCSGADSSSVHHVRPGVLHRFINDQRGPWRIHTLEIDLTQSDLEIGSGRALDKLFGRERTSSIANRHSSDERNVIAALNSDFFSLKTGEIENNNVIESEFVKGTKMTGSPFDTFNNIHSQFAVSQERKPLIDRFEFVGSIFWKNGSMTHLFGVNDIPNSNTVVLFNHYYGNSTPTDTVKMAIHELPLSELFYHSDTLYTIVSGAARTGGTPLAKGSIVLSGYNVQDGDPFSTAKRGDTVKIYLGLKPDRGLVKALVGGWPRIVLDGKNIASSADSLEGTFPRFSSNRHPRSGVGFSKDSTRVFFIVVDGRTQSSVGMSLVEFADLMITSGIYQGMNLDGGGSTTLVVDGNIVNSPSDPFGERAVGNCLLLYATKNK
jgi:hypothetical protein